MAGLHQVHELMGDDHLQAEGRVGSELRIDTDRLARRRARAPTRFHGPEAPSLGVYVHGCLDAPYDTWQRLFQLQAIELLERSCVGNGLGRVYKFAPEGDETVAGWFVVPWLRARCLLGAFDVLHNPGRMSGEKVIDLFAARCVWDAAKDACVGTDMQVEVLDALALDKNGYIASVVMNAMRAKLHALSFQPVHKRLSF